MVVFASSAVGAFGDGVTGGAIAGLLGALAAALLSALTKLHDPAVAKFDWPGELRALLQPAGIGDWVGLLGVLMFALLSGLLVAAVYAARHGQAAAEEDVDSPARPSTSRTGAREEAS